MDLGKLVNATAAIRSKLTVISLVTAGAIMTTVYGVGEGNVAIAVIGFMTTVACIFALHEANKD